MCKFLATCTCGYIYMHLIKLIKSLWICSKLTHVMLVSFLKEINCFLLKIDLEKNIVPAVNVFQKFVYILHMLLQLLYLAPNYFIYRGNRKVHISLCGMLSIINKFAPVWSQKCNLEVSKQGTVYDGYWNILLHCLN